MLVCIIGRVANCLMPGLICDPEAVDVKQVRRHHPPTSPETFVISPHSPANIPILFVFVLYFQIPASVEPEPLKVEAVVFDCFVEAH
ncbi:hypothetical protein Zmor_006966 [Zophobas morio]|uniref:Uncharacterized protein n=1 Tax=Zophobas morio TaxID=2755281 RepID=A0AA38IT44_9CUCU|nr:hypothetical protein Zmor_006966 [Zophobas morio]